MSIKMFQLITVPNIPTQLCKIILCHKQQIMKYGLEI